MTGEITLRGRVLPIGGLKEKLLAALRAGIKTVVIPEENVKDLAEIGDEIKSQPRDRAGVAHGRRAEGCAAARAASLSLRRRRRRAAVAAAGVGGRGRRGSPH